MKREKLIKFIKENKWIIAASIFFIIWKFFLIGVLWNNRSIPPEPDDSYVYIGYINSVKTCPEIICNYPNISFSSETGFTYLSYRIFFGIISKLLNISPEKVFYLSFYFGIVILIPILILFLKNISTSKKQLAFFILFLALYNGSGSYHGFFWVVPSFFTLALFLLILHLINSSIKNWAILFLFLVPFFIYLHPISIYSISIIILSFFFTFIFERKIDKKIIKKIAFIILISFIAYLPMYLYLKHNSSLNPIGIENTVKNASENISQSVQIGNKNIFPGFKEIKNSYLDWIFPNWLGIFPFLFFLLTNIIYKRYKLISLYLASSIFVFFSSFNELGFRSLLFLWPITFLFYASGFWYSYKLIKNKIKNKSITLFILSTFLLLFFAINMLFSLFWNQNSNYNNRIKICNNYNESFINYLNENTSKEDRIAFDSKIIHSFSLTTNLIKKEMEVKKTPAGEKYFVVMKKNEYSYQKETNLDKFFNIISKVIGIDRNKKIEKNKEIFGNENYTLEEEFESVLIYKNKHYRK